MEMVLPIVSALFAIGAAIYLVNNIFKGDAIFTKNAFVVGCANACGVISSLEQQQQQKIES